MSAPQSFLDGRVTLHIGDVRAALDAMTRDSVDCVVTSPPYWGLRDYGVAGQIGLEPTLGEHLDVMVDVFERVKRVLKPEGTLWLNYGDCYATAPNGRSAAATKAAGTDDRTFRDKPFSTVGPIYGASSGRDAPGPPANGSKRRGGGNAPSGGTLKPKDLCMVPNRLAIALQDAGWWVRSEIVWGKPNPMPESIRDRPATSHEKVFLLTKSQRYCYDASAVRQGRASDEDANGFRGGSYVGGEPGPRALRGNVKVRASDVAAPRHTGHISHTGIEATPRGQGRNLKNYERAPLDVWEIATHPFAEAHFATFPPELAARAIRAGCPKGGLVLDPFGGAGTTALVALRLGRRAALIELSPAYAEIAQARIERDWRERPPAPRRRAAEASTLLGLFDAEAAE